jgi:hypothetical protein
VNIVGGRVCHAIVPLFFLTKRSAALLPVLAHGPHPTTKISSLLDPVLRSSIILKFILEWLQLHYFNEFQVSGNTEFNKFSPKNENDYKLFFTH